MFVIKRRSLVIISVLLLTVLTFIICFSAIGNTETNSSTKIKIVLDAGHGGIDGGVVGVNTKVKESELNLSITKKTEKLLVDAGFLVVLTRSTDAGLYGLATTSRKRKEMEKRKQIIIEENPNLVVSIHMNTYCLSSRRGGQVFFKYGDSNGEILATCIQDCFNDYYEIKEYSPLKGDYYILNCTNIPSVIAECGFLSNSQDESILISEKGQEDISYCIFKGIVKYLSKTSSLDEN